MEIGGPLPCQHCPRLCVTDCSVVHKPQLTVSTDAVLTVSTDAVESPSVWTPHDCGLPVRKRRGRWNPVCMCLFSALSDPLLCDILSYLPLSARASMAFVSSRWQHVVTSSPSLWSTVVLAAETSASDVVSSLAVLSRGPFAPLVRELHLPKLRVPLPPALAPALPAASSLSARGAILEPPFAAALLAGCPQLASVAVDASSGVDGPALAALSAAAPAAMRVLSLKSCRLLTSEALSSVRLPLLTTLDVSSCRLVHASAVAAVAASCGPVLQHLFMRGVQTTDRALADIAALCPKLLTLEFGSSNPFGGGVGGSFTHAALRAFASACPSLQHLCATGSDTGLPDAGAGAALALAPALTSLDLSGNALLGPATLTALAAACPRLLRLSLFRCGQVRGQELLLLRSLPRLAHVDVSHCALVSGEAVVDLSHACAGLRSLVAAGLPSLRDEKERARVLGDARQTADGSCVLLLQ